MNIEGYREVWGVDFEFCAPPGERPRPVCMVAAEFASGRTIRWWRNELEGARMAPYPTDPGVLFVAYYASAELSCHLALDWPLPARVLDLYAEFRNITNGQSLIAGRSLLGALTWFGLDSMDVAEKESMRDLAMRGGPWTAEERAALLTYCEQDVRALERLLPAMLPRLKLPYALPRGRYMAALARMEHRGIPIDTDTLFRLRNNWSSLQERLVARVDREFGVFDGLTFKRDLFARWLVDRRIAWPRLESGSLALDDDTFKAMSYLYPALTPLREVLQVRSQLKVIDLSVGRDGRNRCMLSAFSARTGRNQPSTSKFIFGFPKWLRRLIRPASGAGLAYIDWAQQEFGIAAALSGDDAMLEAYATGDPYLTFAVQAGAAPPSATKATHSAVREQFKAAALAVLYGMGAASLAARTNLSVLEAQGLLRLHHETYPRFWRWSDRVVDHANLHGRLHTVFDWRVWAGTNPRFLRNFPMQANGAEMLRLACMLATERSIGVCAPVHDAVLIEAPAADLEAAAAAMQQAMAEASSIVLAGFPLRSDSKLIRYPERFEDERGAAMWRMVEELLEEAEGVASVAQGDGS
jgi:DNA polymerase I